MTKQTQDFDPNAAASLDAGIFGVPGSFDEAALVFVPVPWEATTSYGGGTAQGPAAIFDASAQVDLFDLELGNIYEGGFFLQPVCGEFHDWNEEGKAEAQKVIESGGQVEGDAVLEKALSRVNALSEKVNQLVQKESAKVLKAVKILALIGGDHSCPLGALRALGEKHKDFGVLHFDAHSDTRDAYEGFKYSHASIMRNVLEEVPQVSKLVQVGIRDFCEEEYVYTKERAKRVSVHYDVDLQRRKFAGDTWAKICEEIVADLPKEVWISFDIDGLDPRFCPNTGTPVPGGLDFQEACFLVRTLVKSGRKIIGFDLNEVSPDQGDSEDEWDANVGARLLYKLTGWCLESNGKLKKMSV